MSDPFAELFRTLRVRSAVYFAQNFAAPWGLALPQRPDVQFHVALAGSASVRWTGGELTLGEREVVLFPNGIAHTVSDGDGAVVKPAPQVAQAIRRGENPFPGDPPAVRLLSGHFEFDRAARHPLLRQLPDLIRARAPADAEAYKALQPLISKEASSGQPGAQIIVERLAEIFLVQVLRSHFAEQGAPHGLLGVLFDPRLAAGVTAIHHRWAEPLTLAEIAKAAGMSRSAFAAAFAESSGVTPMAYLAQWRPMKGRELLANRNVSVAQVAAACGHRSTEGFSRAFRRLYGQSPKAMRVDTAVL